MSDCYPDSSMAETAETFVQSGSNPHKVPGDAASGNGNGRLDPLVEVEEARRMTAAEQARTILAGSTVGTLASLMEDGSPWASVVQYGVTGDGTPVILVSTLALHGRNLLADDRVSLAVAGPVPKGHDAGDSGRVSISGRVERPTGKEQEAAERAFFDAVPSAQGYISWDDFTLYVIRPEKVRWVGGFGRMASANPAEYAEAEVDPVAPQANYAVEHMNDDHADALLAMAKAFTGHTDATAAKALRADRYGMDLGVSTPRGNVSTRVEFSEPIRASDGLRAATVDLARRAREVLGEPAPAAH